MQEHIEYLQQVDNGSSINEQSPLYEINLKQEYNNRAEKRKNYAENYQPFTTNQYENQRIKLSTNLAVSASHEEPSRWLPKQDDSPLLKTAGNNTAELLKKVNEALETPCEDKDEKKNEIQELFDKINEILKPDDSNTKNKANKVSNPSHIQLKSRYFFLPRGDEFGYTRRDFRSDENRASFDNDRYRMYRNTNNDTIPYINYVPDSIHENIRRDDVTRARESSFYNSSYLDNTIANLEEQFTGASLEYWGDHSIDSVEHSLMQSEWNILKSSNDSVNWLQHSSSWSAPNFV